MAVQAFSRQPRGEGREEGAGRARGGRAEGEKKDRRE